MNNVDKIKKVIEEVDIRLDREILANELKPELKIYRKVGILEQMLIGLANKIDIINIKNEKW